MADNNDDDDNCRDAFFATRGYEDEEKTMMREQRSVRRAFFIFHRYNRSVDDAT